MRPWALISPPDRGWRKSSGGQRMTWQKEISEVLSKIEIVRLPGWCSRDGSIVRLSTLRDMVLKRSRWRECCRMLSDSG